MLPERIWAVKNHKGPMRRFIILFLLLLCNTRLLLFGFFFYLIISPCHHCPQCPLLTIILDGDSHWGEVSLSSPSLHPLTETKGSSLRTLHPESEIFLRSISDCTPNQPTIPQTSPLTPTCTLNLFFLRPLGSNTPSSSLMKRASGRNVKLLPPCFTWCIG